MFSGFFQGNKTSSGAVTNASPVGLDTKGPRNAVERLATHVNKSPILITFAIICVLILGTTIALMAKKSSGPAPVKVEPSGDNALVKNTQISLQESAREQAAHPPIPPAAATSSAVTGQAVSTASVTHPSAPVTTVAAPLPAQGAPTAADAQQPSPQVMALEDALKAPLSSRGSSMPAVAAPQIPSEAEALQQAVKSAGVHLPEAETPSSAADYNTHLLRRPVSPFEVLAGSTIPAVLETGIDSDLPGQITALVSQPVYSSVSGAYVLIPAGTKIVGTYASSPKMGQNRVFVAWTQLIFPNGTTMNLSGFPGASPRGYAGFEDEVDDHTWSIFKNALLISLIQTGISLSQPGYGSVGTTNAQAISPAQVAEQNLANTFGQAEADLLQNSINVSPTLKIRPGYTFGVTVTKTLIFPGPYRSVVAPQSTEPQAVAAAAIPNPYQTGAFPAGNSQPQPTGSSASISSMLQQLTQGIPAALTQGKSSAAVAPETPGMSAISGAQAPITGSFAP